MRVYFCPIMDPKYVIHHQQFYKTGMSHSEEILPRMIRNSIIDRGQCTRSNKTKVNPGKVSKEKNMCTY